MKDNLSMVILIILLVLVAVMFPLYNYFERQDDMSYNVVLKATTNFVDEVLNAGYVDQDMYDRYTTQLSSTGNIYDVQLEAHKKTKVATPENENKYTEESSIDYNSQIFQSVESTTVESDLNSKTLIDGIYKLNEGDEFYVKLKNDSTTMAGSIFNFIVPTSTKERIKVNYGGVVKNNTWASVDADFLAKETDVVYFSVKSTKSPDDPYYTESEIVHNDDNGDEYLKNITSTDIYITQGGVYKIVLDKNFNNSSSSGFTFYSAATGDSTETLKVDNTKEVILTEPGIINVHYGSAANTKVYIVNIKTGKKVDLKMINSNYIRDELIISLENKFMWDKMWVNMANSSQSYFTTNGTTTAIDGQYMQLAGEEDGIQSEIILGKPMTYDTYTMQIAFKLDEPTSGREEHIFGNPNAGGVGIIYQYVDREYKLDFEFNRDATSLGYNHFKIKLTEDEVNNPIAVAAVFDYNDYTKTVFYIKTVNGLYIINKDKTGGNIEKSTVNVSDRTIKRSNSRLSIGVNPNANDSEVDNGTNPYYFKGKIYSAQLYKRMLSETEVKQNLNQAFTDIGI